MRLHRLEVTAFGPFAGTEQVDFDALADGGLFLFTGATGAGKTSVLDAVCFALYGQVPGTRGGRALRSDHAGDSVAPEVVLETTLRGRRLRITRSPQWERPKRRGSGTTLEQARVIVAERVAGDGWVTLSTRLDEAGDLLSGLLGLTLPQFAQVVLLPQGQFAAFLRASAEQRRDLLESLFDTGRFAAVERWLVARRQQTGRALDDAEARLGQVLARVSEAAAAEQPDQLAPDLAVDWLAGLRSHAEAGLAQARNRLAAGEERLRAATGDLEQAARISAALARRSALRERLDVLLAGAAAQAAAAEEVSAARAVAPLLPLVTEVARIQLELDAARALAADSRAALSRSLPSTGTDGPSPASPGPTQLSEAAQRHRAEVVTLRLLGDDEAEADRLGGAVDDFQRRVVELADEAARLERRLAEAPARREELEAARDASAAAVAALPGAQAAASGAAEHLAAAVRRDQLALERLVAAADVRARTDDEQRRREQWLDLRAARLDGMAAELAAGLADGSACPVCGSADHPQPARPGADSVTREQEEVAASLVRAAEEARSAAQGVLATIDAALAASRAAAGGDGSHAALSAARDRADEEVGRLQALAGAAADDARALREFDAEREGWLRAQVALDQDARTVADQVAADRSKLTDLRLGLDRARGDDPSIAARADRLEQLAADLEGLARQVDTVDRLAADVAAAHDRADEETRRRGLPSLEMVLAAARSDEVVAGLDEAHRRHESELQSLRDQLAEPGLAGLDDAASPDLARLHEQVAAAEAEHTATVGELAAATGRVAALDRLGTALGEVLTERRPLAETHRTVDGLARLAEGKSTDNRLRMSLSGYVLAARLEQVAASASERLSRMSSGRYQLVHTATPGSGRARGGLQLRVLDAWTGVERDPATLSGGECFLASLSLALGLAEVVAAEAGGTLLETLFVDEGFGSLDDDTLDEVMGVLDGLRDGGRAVGIVSHVADLRARIPVQLRIAKGRSGSHISQ